MRFRLFGEEFIVFERFTISAPRGEPYLDRFILVKSRIINVFLHHILTRDPDRHLHDHPWDFVSIVLRGSYWEDRGGADNFCHIFWFNKKKAEDAHRIVWVRPNTWTLILAGVRRRAWGFHTEDGWEHWRQYLKKKFPDGFEAGPQLECDA